MQKKYKLYKFFGIVLFAFFSFFYTSKATTLIRNNDPIMLEIRNNKEDYLVSKIDPIIINDEYYTGINGCEVDEMESYNKMKSVGSFKEELLVMKQDKIEDIDKYIIGGNKHNRNVSIILLDSSNTKLNNYFKDNNIKINYFLDSNYINKNILSLKKISNYTRIYNFGRNKEYLNKYIIYDNNMIESYLNNKSRYCLLLDKNEEMLNLCTQYNMKTIKSPIISDLSSIKELLSNGKIFVLDNNNYNDIVRTIKYIYSKGYDIVFLDELLNEENDCN